MTDIDLDFADRNAALACVKHIPASRLENNILKKHASGVYFRAVPVDPNINACAIPYDQLSTTFKIDFLNVSVYKKIKNEEHLNALINTEPVWELLEHKECVEQLFQISQHHALLVDKKPKSVLQLAAVISLIRPSKQYLIDKSWDEILENVWIPPTDGSYYFKKGHAIAYAMIIVAQLNLMAEELNNEPTHI